MIPLIIINLQLFCKLMEEINIDKIAILEAQLLQSKKRQNHLKKINDSLVDALRRPSQQLIKLNLEINNLRMNHIHQIQQLNMSQENKQRQLNQTIQLLKQQLVTQKHIHSYNEEKYNLLQNQNIKLLNKIRQLQKKLLNLQQVINSQKNLVFNTKKNINQQILIEKMIIQSTLQQKQIMLKCKYEEFQKKFIESKQKIIEDLKTQIKILNAKINYYQKQKKYSILTSKKNSISSINSTQYKPPKFSTDSIKKINPSPFISFV